MIEMSKKITKEWLQEQNACASGIRWFLKQDKTESLEVLEALIADNKLSDANWLIARVMDRNQKLAYAIFAAEQVLHLYEAKYPGDDRPRKAIEAAKAVMDSDTEDTRAAAAAYASANADSAAYAAANAAANAANAAYAAAYAAEAANAARAADAAAWAAAAAANAAEAADAAEAAAEAADDSAAWAEAVKAMRLKILRFGIALLEGEG